MNLPASGLESFSQARELWAISQQMLYPDDPTPDKAFGRLVTVALTLFCSHPSMHPSTLHTPALTVDSVLQAFTFSTGTMNLPYQSPGFSLYALRVPCMCTCHGPMYTSCTWPKTGPLWGPEQRSVHLRDNVQSRQCNSVIWRKSVF